MPKAKAISHFVKDLIDDRSSHRKCSVRKDVLRNFAKFTGKHLGESLFFNKVSGLSTHYTFKNSAVCVLRQ